MIVAEIRLYRINSSPQTFLQKCLGLNKPKLLVKVSGNAEAPLYWRSFNPMRDIFCDIEAEHQRRIVAFDYLPSVRRRFEP
jgi:hypothetical protein